MLSRILPAVLMTALAIVSVWLSAQAVYGTIVGTVTDASGGAVPNARVTIRDMDRDVSNVTTTNESGNYTQRYLIVGRYQVRVEATGFQTFVEAWTGPHF